MLTSRRISYRIIRLSFPPCVFYSLNNPAACCAVCALACGGWRLHSMETCTGSYCGGGKAAPQLLVRRRSPGATSFVQNETATVTAAAAARMRMSGQAAAVARSASSRFSHRELA